MYVDGEVIEKMIVTILEGFERIERKLDCLITSICASC